MLIEDLAPRGEFGPRGTMAETMPMCIPEGPWMYLPCEVRGLPEPRAPVGGFLLLVMMMAIAAGGVGFVWGEVLLVLAGFVVLALAIVSRLFAGVTAATWRWILGHAGDVSWHAGFLVATDGARVRILGWRRSGPRGAWSCRLAWEGPLASLEGPGPLERGRFGLRLAHRLQVRIGPLPAGHPLMALVTCRKGCLMSVKDLWALLEALREQVAVVPFDVDAAVPFHTRRR